MPYHRAVTELAREHGVDIFFFDSDGNLNLMLPHLLEAGINLFYPIECAADMDPLVLRATYGRQLRMIGGIDKRALAAGKAAIRAELERKLPPLLADGGYLPRVDHSIGTDISLENFRYYVKLLWELFEKR
jgi:uroporphyrinogen decarboxylase